MRTRVVPRHSAVPRAGRRFCLAKERYGDDERENALHAGRVELRPAGARARRPRSLGAGALVRRAAQEERGRPALLVHRRPDHRQHRGDGRPPRLGTHVQGSIPALQGDAGIRSALAERLRLPGPVGRGAGRARAQPQQQARHRALRHRQVLTRLPRPCRSQCGRDHEALHSPRAVDGLGQLVLHVQRQQHLAHLERLEAVPREGLALQGPPCDAVVRAVRHRTLRARDDRLVQGHDAYLSICALPGARRKCAPFDR